MEWNCNIVCVISDVNSGVQETIQKLRNETGIMRKKFTSLQKEIDDHKEEIRKHQAEIAKLNGVIRNLEKDIAGLKKEIQERDETIQDKVGLYLHAKTKIHSIVRRNDLKKKKKKDTLMHVIETFYLFFTFL